MSRPVLHAVLAIAFLSGMDAIIKGLVAGLPVLEVTWMRYLVGSAVMGAIAAAARPGWPSAETLRANAARAVIVVVTAVSFFYALGQLPLAETLIISFVSPTFTALLAALILGERIERRVLVALAAGFAGVAVIVAAGLGTDGAAPDGRQGSLLGVAAVIVASLGYSASNVLLRARAQRDPLLLIVLIQNVAPCLMLAGPAALVWRMPAGRELVLLACVGTLGVAGHLLLARAYAKAEATRLAPLDYTALIWALVFGFLAYGEVPNAWTLLGGALILASAYSVARRPPATDRPG